MLLNSAIYPGAQTAIALLKEPMKYPAASNWKASFLGTISALVGAQEGQDTQTALLSAKVALVEAEAQLQNPELKGRALIFASFQKQNALRNLAKARLSAETPKANLDPDLTGRARSLAAFERDNAANPECSRYTKKD